MSTVSGRRRAGLLIVVAAVSWLSGCYNGPSVDTSGSDVPSAVPDTISNDLRALAEAGSGERMLAIARERGYTVTDDGVRVDVQTHALEAADRQRFDISGVSVEAFSAKYQRVSAIVSSPAALRRLGGVSVVRVIAPAYGSR